MHVKGLVAATVLAGALLTSNTAGATEIRVQSTTDTVDANLVEGLLRPAYAKAQPGDTLNYIGVGTGKALDNGRAGLADVVITHAPSLEAQFVQQGYSFEPLGRAIFYSDYVVVGPKDDPAGVSAAAPHDAAAAYEKIAAAGPAGNAYFISRGDNSGTNVQEQIIWGLTNGIPRKKGFGSGTATDRFEPSNGGNGDTDYPAWYKVQTGGQSANLQRTDACAAAAGASKCYTMVDRGTFNRNVDAGTVTRLKIVSDKNAPGTRGGENLLVNPFSAYVVNPDKIGTTPKPDTVAGTRFLDFLTSPEFQAAIDGFPSASDPAFRSDAFPKVDGTPPTVGVQGTAVPLALTVSDKLPGGGAVAGIPVQLQQSVAGAPFTDVGAPVGTDAAGKVGFLPTLGATTTYRVSLPRYLKFSPNVQTLGVVAATPPAVAPTPPVLPGPKPPSADKKKPRSTKVKLTAKRLSVVVSERATIKVTITKKTTRRKGSKRITRYVTVKRLTLRAKRSGRTGRSFKRLSAGTYRITLRTTDAAGNVQTRKLTFKVKKAARKPAKRAS